ncbi:hypothetical protein FACS189426_22800 [Bacteroidia bacterium]|nr:hypothetical protein FACS189426_22800 [Bacteroidia bacterium]
MYFGKFKIYIVKKLSIKESTYGDISGNVSDAKEKMMTFLNKQIKT